MDAEIRKGIAGLERSEISEEYSDQGMITRRNEQIKVRVETEREFFLSSKFLACTSIGCGRVYFCLTFP